MQRRDLILALGALAAPRIVRAQPVARLSKVGYLSLASPAADRRRFEAFRQGLRELGYAEGKNLLLEERYALNRIGDVPGLAAELVARGVSVIVLYGSPAARAVERAGVPIVLTVHPDPVGAGLARTLAKPGGAITGLTDGHMELGPKRLEIFREIVPSIARVAALHNPATGHALGQYKLVAAAAPRFGVTVLPVEVKTASAIDAAFREVDRAHADAVFIIPDPSWSAGNERQIAQLAIARRLPAIGTISTFADQGALVAFGTNFVELWRRAASYVDKILKGARPGDLPIEFPTKFDLVINLKTASSIGVAVPRGILARADRIIE
jgi:putative ABC transport system substrate-binding protein